MLRQNFGLLLRKDDIHIDENSFSGVCTVRSTASKLKQSLVRESLMKCDLKSFLFYTR
jgi:hypothetical protein